MAVTVFPNMELNCASIGGSDTNGILDHEIHTSLVQQLSNTSGTLTQQLNGSNSGSSGRSTPNNAGEPAPGKLFVGGLSWQTSSDKLREYFSMFGSVTDVLIMKDPVTARSRGFGFITFSDPTSVDKVLKVPIHTLDGKKIDPKHATPKNRPKPTNKTKKIFVGGVSQDTSSDEVKTYFNQFGKVEETVMLMDQQTKRHRGFGFVTFENEDVVDRVCEIHFHTIKNKKVECKKAQPKEAVQANAQLLGKRIILGSLGMRMAAAGTPATAGSIAAAAAAAAASNPLAMVQAHQVHAQAAAAAAAAAQAQSAAATVAGYSKLFGAAAAAAAYPPLGSYHHRYAPYPLAGAQGVGGGGASAPGAGGAGSAQPVQSVTGAGNNPYQGYSLTNVDMTSFQGVDWGAMYGMAGISFSRFDRGFSKIVRGTTKNKICFNTRAMSNDKAKSLVNSDGFKDDLSIRDKSLLKRSISKHHNNNFKIGYVPANEEALQKTGLRGRKTFAFWTLIALIFALAMANMALTITILSVLKVGRGLESLELIPDHESIKFYGNTDFADIYKRDGKLEGFSDYPVLINSDNGSIVFKILPRNGRSVVRFLLDADGIIVPNTALLTIKDKRNELVFTTDEPTYNVQTPMRNFDSKFTQTNRIVSNNDNNLDIETKSYVNIKGAEGVSMDGKEIVWSADQNIFLKSINGSILLSSGEGIFIDMKKIPIVNLLPKYTEFVVSQYKVCVCMPQGKLFRIPVPKERNSRAYCTHINTDHQNPCM